MMRKSLFIKDYRVVAGVQNHFAQKKRGSKFLSKNHFSKVLISLKKLERAMGSEPLFFYLIVFTKNTIFKNQDFRLNVTHFGHSMITPKLCESLHQIYSLSRG